MAKLQSYEISPQKVEELLKIYISDQFTSPEMTETTGENENTKKIISITIEEGKYNDPSFIAHVVYREGE